MTNSLVIYKEQPAIVRGGRDKLEILLLDGTSRTVRLKDVVPLHPGPITNLKDLKPCDGDLETAWEMLAGESTTVEEIAELAFEAFTPATAWAVWQAVVEGLYFEGSPESVRTRTGEEVESERNKRDQRQREREEWAEFISRVDNGSTLPSDADFLKDTVAVALGERPGSRLLKELNRGESPENAHALLLQIKHWDESFNPYPQRSGIALSIAETELPELPEEERLDLTHLPAYAIDDEGNKDPDDAISLDGDFIWVHVADVAALVTPDSAADIDARGRASNLYLPERVISMLPTVATEQLGLGLHGVSPALSFKVSFDDTSGVHAAEVHKSLVRVERISYTAAQERLEEEPFKSMFEHAERFRQYRVHHHAVEIELPEVKVSVSDGEVSLTPFQPLQSRALVREAMLMAGSAVGRLAIEQQIPLPFSTQEGPDSVERPTDLAGMYELRRSLKRSQLRSVAGLHAGLGLETYVQATSPLRRYLDLVVHQQLRAWLAGEELISEQELLERVGSAESLASELRRAERFSRQHWTMVYLQRQTGWRGEAIVMSQQRQRAKVLVPSLGLEPTVYASQELAPNTALEVELTDVDLPNLLAHFRVV